MLLTPLLKTLNRNPTRKIEIKPRVLEIAINNKNISSAFRKVLKGGTR